MASISCQHIYKVYPGATAPSVTDSIPFRAASRLAASKVRSFRSKFPLSRTSV